MLKLQDLLNDWQMPYLLEKLLDCGISNIDTLMYLTEHDLDAIFETQCLGDKVKFRHKLREWLKANNIRDSWGSFEYLESKILEIHSILMHAPFASRPAVNDEFNVDQFFKGLEKDAKNNYLCDENENQLSPNGRTLLVERAVEFYVTQKKFMNDKIFVDIAKQICRKFKDEREEVYYNSKEKAGGKLYNAYTKSVYRLRKVGLFPLKNKRKRTNSPETTLDTTLDSEMDNPDKEWLKYYTNSWPEVRKRWERTLKARISEIKNLSGKNLSAVLTEWPAYKSDFGKDLIDIDFEGIQKNPLALHTKWEDFVKKFTIKAPGLIKDKKSLAQLSYLDCIENPDLRNALIFNLMSSLIAPSICMKSKSLKKWKFSIEDSQRYFILHIPTADDLQAQLESLAKELADYDLTLQPLVVIIETSDGDITIFGIYDSIKYKYDTLLDAISNMFKMHFVFDLHYQKPCSNVWNFIEQYFFDIASHKACLRVNELCTMFAD